MIGAALRSFILQNKSSTGSNLNYPELNDFDIDRIKIQLIALGLIQTDSATAVGAGFKSLLV
jgi:hypothetical protein